MDSRNTCAWQMSVSVSTGSGSQLRAMWTPAAYSKATAAASAST